MRFCPNCNWPVDNFDYNCDNCGHTLWKLDFKKPSKVKDSISEGKIE